MSLRPPPTLAELIKEPFGPYLEGEALTNSVGNTTRKKVVSLECLQLEAGGVTTGLTECEPTMPEFDRERFKEKDSIRFHGVLQIQSLSWLTPEAIDDIEKELRKRDIRARSVHNVQARPSTLTLKALYTQTPGFQRINLKVKVKIQGVKNMTAVYLTSETVPNGLMINTRGRRYAVKSMHIHTYELSRAFLSRYRLLHTLQTLLALDANTNHVSNNLTPLYERTPEWFVDLYLKHMAHSGAARQHRPHYASSDSDIEPGTNGRMKRGREHTLRHVSRAEIHSRIAEHGEWVVEQVKNMKFKWFDVDIWERWLIDVRRNRRKAAKAGWRWGVWDGEDVTVDHDDMDIDDPPPAAAPKRGRVHKKRTGQRRPPGPKIPLPSLYAPYTPQPYSGPYNDDVDGTMQRTYDRDFSPESTTLGDSDSPSCSSVPSRSTTPTDPDLVAILPSAFFYPPNITSTFKWVCSAKDCDYTIDLLNLTDENLDTQDITEVEKQRLRSKRWNARELWVRDAFAYMVDKHQDGHIDEWGIKIEQVNGRWKASWKHPASHRSDSRLRKVVEDQRRFQIAQDIKEEDN